MRCKHENINEQEIFVPKKEKTIIGGLDFLDEYIIRSEMSNAVPKIFIRKINTNTEEELIINGSNEQVGSLGVAAMQNDTNTSKIWISWESLATPGKAYEYDIVSKDWGYKSFKGRIYSDYSPEIINDFISQII